MMLRNVMLAFFQLAKPKCGFHLTIFFNDMGR